MSALVVNLFSGPGSGKSTVAANIFSELKWAGINCELATEYAKDKVWEESFEVLKNQIYVFGKQHHRLFVLKEKVDVIIVDSPLPLTMIYDQEKRIVLEKLVMEEFLKFDNINFFIKRKKEYNPKGRLHSENESKNKDKEIEDMLLRLKEEYEIKYSFIDGTRDGVKEVCDIIFMRIGMNSINTNIN